MTIWYDGIEINSQLRIIRHRGAVVRFRNLPRFQLIKHLILGFHNRGELFDVLYGDREDGGPDGDTTYISIMMCQMRREITALGLQWRKEKGAHYHTRYRLQPTVMEAAE